MEVSFIRELSPHPEPSRTVLRSLRDNLKKAAIPAGMAIIAARTNIANITVLKVSPERVLVMKAKEDPIAATAKPPPASKPPESILTHQNQY